MKRIVQAVCLAALLAGTKIASAIVRSTHHWWAKSQAESAYPADAEEASFNLPAIEPFA